MKPLAADFDATESLPTTETISLPQRHATFLSQISSAINPDMPAAFGWPHAIRLILERIEESGIDLTEASTEHEIASVAAVALRPRSRRTVSR